MSYRFMRILIFFDLPTESLTDKKEYRHFRKFLLNNGFMMMQESVYSKIVLNATVAKSVINNIKRHSPPKGLVQMLLITEKQYSNIEFIVGEMKTSIVNSDKRTVIL